jgi:hypothetical protein
MRRLALLLTAFFTLLTASFGLAPAARAAWVWPVSGEVITPYRNGTDPYANGQHRGIDIAAPTGTPVVAAAGGEVRFAGTAGSSGMTISIRTGDGYDTSYLHLSSLAVRVGANVSAGDRIGALGTSGTRSATAPHLHFGVRDAGTRHDYHDPLAFLPPPPPPARAPNPPPSAPATAPEPAPPPATPVTVPRAAPKPRAVPRPHALPRPRPIATPRRQPHALPHRAPHAVRAPRAIPAPRVTPAPHATRALRGFPAPRVARVLGAVPAPNQAPHGTSGSRSARTAGSAPISSSHALSAPAGTPHIPAPRHAAPGLTDEGSDGDSAGRPDLGWIAACMGLLLAAGVLGLSGDSRTGTPARIGRLIRPLVARR